MKLKDFAGIVKGVIQGNPETEITGVSGIMDANEGDITFVSSAKYLRQAHQSKASCIIVKEPIPDIKTSQLCAPNPYFVFAKAIECFYPESTFEPGISEKAIVSNRALLGKDVSVYAFACLSDNISIGDGTVIMPGVFVGEKTKIGKHCVIHPNVVIREGVIIGDRVVIHSGTVIGSDGYGYTFEKGEHYKIPQVGGVIIEDDVEIGSNVSIDRATLGNTVIGRGTKIDNLVQIAHNVKIGEKSLIMALAGIAGSSEIGSYVTIGGHTAIADHTVIESGTMIAGKSGLFGHVTKGVYSGSPAIPHKDWLRSQALFAKLPEMYKRIIELEVKINKLERGDSV
ncbi:MAG: UDP-3-O-(3-hydroxymyristoyl)glucosamine N-acyltransferase [Nitrospira bacterium HGW-Nitrospira-1]|nr:MAG: UDP-3-O-(3-hydroxymyristoyl)glucosamine N-acyltransferase [Nitrospira bacterium HGW-Nitrospira-1]